MFVPEALLPLYVIHLRLIETFLGGQPVRKEVEAS